MDKGKPCQLLMPALAVAVLLSTSMMCLAAQRPLLSPGDLVRKTITNEVSAENDATRFMFRSQKETPQGSRTKLFVETRDVTAAILLAIDGQPLNDYQRRAEESRLLAMMNNPAELRKAQRQEKEEDERVDRIMRAMPDAFLYEYDGTEMGRPGIGKPGDVLVRLNFRPNPTYDAPTRTEQVLTGMRGDVLIDADRYRIAKIEGTLFRDVTFGWGILAHLDRGGRFVIELGDLGDSSWGITRMSLDFTGKVLFIKSLVIKSDEVFSDYRRVPDDLTFAQGIALLEKESRQSKSQAPVPGSRSCGSCPTD